MALVTDKPLYTCAVRWSVTQVIARGGATQSTMCKPLAEVYDKYYDKVDEINWAEENNVELPSNESDVGEAEYRAHANAFAYHSNIPRSSANMRARARYLLLNTVLTDEVRWDDDAFFTIWTHLATTHTDAGHVNLSGRARAIAKAAMIYSSGMSDLSWKRNKEQFMSTAWMQGRCHEWSQMSSKLQALRSALYGSAMKHHNAVYKRIKDHYYPKKTLDKADLCVVALKGIGQLDLELRYVPGFYIYRIDDVDCVINKDMHEELIAAMARLRDAADYAKFGEPCNNGLPFAGYYFPVYLKLKSQFVRDVEAALFEYRTVCPLSEEAMYLHPSNVVRAYHIMHKAIQLGMSNYAEDIEAGCKRKQATLMKMAAESSKHVKPRKVMAIISGLHPRHQVDILKVHQLAIPHQNNLSVVVDKITTEPELKHEWNSDSHLKAREDFTRHSFVRVAYKLTVAKMISIDREVFLSRATSQDGVNLDRAISWYNKFTGGKYKRVPMHLADFIQIKDKIRWKPYANDFQLHGNDVRTVPVAEDEEMMDDVTDYPKAYQRRECLNYLCRDGVFSNGQTPTEVRNQLQAGVPLASVKCAVAAKSETNKPPWKPRDTASADDRAREMMREAEYNMRTVMSLFSGCTQTTDPISFSKDFAHIGQRTTHVVKDGTFDISADVSGWSPNMNDMNQIATARVVDAMFDKGYYETLVKSLRNMYGYAKVNGAEYGPFKILTKPQGMIGYLDTMCHDNLVSWVVHGINEKFPDINLNSVKWCTQIDDQMIQFGVSGIVMEKIPLYRKAFDYMVAKYRCLDFVIDEVKSGFHTSQIEYLNTLYSDGALVPTVLKTSCKAHVNLNAKLLPIAELGSSIFSNCRSASMVGDNPLRMYGRAVCETVSELERKVKPFMDLPINVAALSLLIGCQEGGLGLPTVYTFLTADYHNRMVEDAVGVVQFIKDPQYENYVSDFLDALSVFKSSAYREVPLDFIALNPYRVQRELSYSTSVNLHREVGEALLSLPLRGMAKRIIESDWREILNPFLEQLMRHGQVDAEILHQISKTFPHRKREKLISRCESNTCLRILFKANELRKLSRRIHRMDVAWAKNLIDAVGTCDKTTVTLYESKQNAIVIVDSQLADFYKLNNVNIVNAARLTPRAALCFAGIDSTSNIHCKEGAKVHASSNNLTPIDDSLPMSAYHVRTKRSQWVGIKSRAGYGLEMSWMKAFNRDAYEFVTVAIAMHMQIEVNPGIERILTVLWYMMTGSVELPDFSLAYDPNCVSRNLFRAPGNSYGNTSTFKMFPMLSGESGVDMYPVEAILNNLQCPFPVAKAINSLRAVALTEMTYDLNCEDTSHMENRVFIYQVRSGIDVAYVKDCTMTYVPEFDVADLFPENWPGVLEGHMAINNTWGILTNPDLFAAFCIEMKSLASSEDAMFERIYNNEQVSEMDIEAYSSLFARRAASQINRFSDNRLNEHFGQLVKKNKYIPTSVSMDMLAADVNALAATARLKSKGGTYENISERTIRSIDSFTRSMMVATGARYQKVAAMQKLIFLTIRKPLRNHRQIDTLFKGEDRRIRFFRKILVNADMKRVIIAYDRMDIANKRNVAHTIFGMWKIDELSSDVFAKMGDDKVQILLNKFIHSPEMVEIRHERDWSAAAVRPRVIDLRVYGNDPIKALRASIDRELGKKIRSTQKTLDAYTHKAVEGQVDVIKYMQGNDDELREVAVFAATASQFRGMRHRATAFTESKTKEITIGDEKVVIFGNLLSATSTSLRGRSSNLYAHTLNYYRRCTTVSLMSAFREYLGAPNNANMVGLMTGLAETGLNLMELYVGRDDFYEEYRESLIDACCEAGTVVELAVVWHQLLVQYLDSVSFDHIDPRDVGVVKDLITTVKTGISFSMQWTTEAFDVPWALISGAIRAHAAGGTLANMAPTPDTAVKARVAAPQATALRSRNRAVVVEEKVEEFSVRLSPARVYLANYHIMNAQMPKDVYLAILDGMIDSPEVVSDLVDIIKEVFKGTDLRNLIPSANLVSNFELHGYSSTGPEVTIRWSNTVAMAAEEDSKMNDEQDEDQVGLAID
jgi:hypothetical protein